jgi:hypothetical protein
MGEQAEPELREALEAAFDEEITDMGDEAPAELLPLDVGEKDPITGDVEEVEKPKEEEEEEEEEVQQQEEVKAEEERVESEEKAPASWTPEEREVWKDVPPSSRAAIKRRESEHSALIKATAENKKVLDQFYGISQKFGAQLAAEGATPLSAYNGFMEMAATLQSGNQQAKAALIHRFMKTYSVDIDMVDQLLVGETPEGVEQEQAPSWAKPLLQDYSNRQTQQQQFTVNNNQNIANETETFLKDQEFGNDVRGEMATLFRVAGEKNQPMTLLDAYEQACQINKGVRDTLAARANKGSIDKAKRAASSVSDTPLGGNGILEQTDDDDLRATLNKAWDAAS